MALFGVEDLPIIFATALYLKYCFFFFNRLSVKGASLLDSYFMNLRLSWNRKLSITFLPM